MGSEYSIGECSMCIRKPVNCYENEMRLTLTFFFVVIMNCYIVIEKWSWKVYNNIVS